MESFDYTEMIFPLIMLGLAGAFVIFLIWLFVSAKRDAKKSDKETKANLNKYNAVALSENQHVYGLPANEGTFIAIYACKDKYIFQHGETTYELPFDRVLDVSVKSETQITNQYTTSLGGAMAGAALLGTAGAVIGGIKQKKNTVVTQYLIFAYSKDDRTEFISFKCYQSKSVMPIIDVYNRYPKQARSVTL